MRRFAWLALVVAACTGPTEPEDTGADSDTDTDTDSDTDTDVEPDVCGSAGRELPADLEELGFDDGAVALDVYDAGWQINGYEGTYAVVDVPIHEAVRFELDRPARVHALSVQWSSIPADADPADLLPAGLYADYGYNGFDFWQWDALWEGTRCVEDVVDGEWLHYVLDTPVDIEQPGLVYVAHRRDDPDGAVFGLDATTAAEGDCGEWDACHSALNLPTTETNIMENGWSFPIPYDYVVRLHVEWLGPAEPEDPVFVGGPEIALGNRTAWGDYDGDGDDDLFTAGPRLYRNDGGSFTDVTTAAGVDQGAANGGVWGDYDNDGCPDLLTFAESAARPDVLLHNACDGTFVDVTEEAGITDAQDYNACGDPETNLYSPTAAAAWLDIDADGLLDLYFANMICWSDYTYYVDAVFHNEGDGTFVRWGGDQGFGARYRAGRGAHPADADGDGDVDLLVNNYVLQANQYYRNNGDGTVTEVAEDVGLAGNANLNGSSWRYGHTIGAAWGDLDGDGDLDSVHANLAHPRWFSFSDKTQVLINDDGVFTDISGDWAAAWAGSEAGLRYQETHSVPVLADFDADGALDLVITAVYPGRPTDFYWGRGDGTFALDVYGSGLTTRNGWGAAASDYDDDGDVDLVTRFAVGEPGVGQPLGPGAGPRRRRDGQPHGRGGDGLGRSRRIDRRSPRVRRVGAGVPGQCDDALRARRGRRCRSHHGSVPGGRGGDVRRAVFGRYSPVGPARRRGQRRVGAARVITPLGSRRRARGGGRPGRRPWRGSAR